MSLSPAEGMKSLCIRLTSPSPSPLSEVSEADKSQTETRADEVKRVANLFLDCLGIEKRMRSELVATGVRTPVVPELSPAASELFDVGLLRQRFLPDLSPDLARVVCRVCVLSGVRPAGSFRFSAVLYPCDVDMEEYVVAVEADRQEALCRLVEWLKLVGTRCEGQANVLWGGLKAGKDPAQSGKVLTWSTDELRKGEKVCDLSGGKERIPLEKALEQGNKSRTAFITIFAKVPLFTDEASVSRFFEITNVIRFGHVSNGQVLPITEEYDFLEVLDGALYGYSGKTPKAMKYARPSADAPFCWPSAQVCLRAGGSEVHCL